VSKLDWVPSVHPTDGGAQTVRADRPAGEIAPVSVLVPQQRRADQALALAALPPAAVMSVRAAYAREVARRLPALESALSSLTGGGAPVDIEAAVRDAHSLASSSAVVGEPTAATALRAVEGLLAEGSFAEAARHLDVAALSLDPWRSGNVPA
jgi:HPt (histidine-containing phosphotransfer) domain-containing protein